MYLSNMIHSIIYSNIGIILWDLDSVEKANVKLKYLTRSGIENFVDGDMSDDYTMGVVGSFVDTLRDRIDKVRTQDTEVKAFVKEEKLRKKRAVHADSDLSDFLK